MVQLMAVPFPFAVPSPSSALALPPFYHALNLYYPKMLIKKRKMPFLLAPTQLAFSVYIYASLTIKQAVYSYFNRKSRKLLQINYFLLKISIIKMQQKLSIRKPLTSCPKTQRNNTMPLYYFIIASVPLFLLLLPVMSPAAAASGGDATTSAGVGTTKQQFQRIDDQGVDGPFSAPEVLSIAADEQQQQQQQDEDEAMREQKEQQLRKQEMKKQQLRTSCDIHNNEPLHALMDRICELCHDMYSHRRPNMRADCRSDCFRSVDFKRCLRLFRPIGQQSRGFRHWVEETEDATLFL